MSGGSMKLVLVVTRGPLRGQKFPISAGLKIGRRLGQIRLDDPKISNLHAFFDVEHGQIVLRDNGSKNGIRVGVERVVSVEVRPGLRFSIGNSEFEVVGSESKGVRTENSPANPASSIQQTDTRKPEARRWSDTILPLLAQVSTGSDKDQVIRPLDPPIKLSILTGPQKNTQWTLGYCPRTVGSQSADLQLIDPSAPPVSFRILPTVGGVEIRTPQPDLVKFNGTSVSHKLIEEGDLILVGQTVIQVEFEQ